MARLKLFMPEGLDLKNEYRDFKEGYAGINPAITHNPGHLHYLFSCYVMETYGFDPRSEESTRSFDFDAWSDKRTAAAAGDRRRVVYHYEPADKDDSGTTVSMTHETPERDEPSRTAGNTVPGPAESVIPRRKRMFKPRGLDLESEYMSFKRGLLDDNSDVSYSSEEIQQLFRGQVIHKYGFDPASRESTRRFDYKAWKMKNLCDIDFSDVTPETILSPSVDTYHGSSYYVPDEPKKPTKSEIEHAERYAASMYNEAKMRMSIPFASWFGGKETSESQIRQANEALEKVGLSPRYSMPTNSDDDYF
jgi:hypothetical protein